MKDLFRDNLLNQQFDRDGYVIITLLSAGQVGQLRHLFNSTTPDFCGEDLYESSRNSTNETNNLINDQLQEVFASQLKGLVADHQILGGSFMAKPAKSQNHLPLHQDWSIVEEAKYQTAFIWCPLQETGPENGGLFLVPGSHKFFNNRKSGSLPCPRVQVGENIKNYVMDVSLDPGQVIIYSDNLFHGSYPNRTNEPRLVATGRIVEDEAKLVYYQLQENGQIAVYHFSKDNYLNGITFLAKGEVPEGLSPAYFEENKNELIDEESFTRKLMGTKYPSKKVQITSERTIKDSRLKRFFTTYTPSNIAKEVYFRLKPQNDHPKKVGEFYNQHHEDFIEVYGELIQAFRTTDTSKILDYEFESIGLKEGMTVLDAGCGVCKPAIHFAAKASIDIKALTVSKRQLEHAGKLIAKTQSEGIELFHEDYHSIDQLFEAGTFDKAYFLESFGHSSDKKNLLRSLWKVLKPSGEVYIKDLFIRKSENKLDQKAILKEVEKINDAYHYQVAELSELIDFARSIGFILVFARTIDIPLEDFENLTISNKFQELTGIYKIESFDSYIFPVDFMEIKLYKPAYNLDEGKDRYFLQNLFHQKPNG